MTKTIWLKGYTKNTPSGHTGHEPRHPGTPSRIGLHFTVTSGLPNYAWPPHLTVGVGHPLSVVTGTPGKPYRWQHCDLNLTSYALAEIRALGGETNNEGAHNVQIEVIARTSGSHWPPELYEVVAQTLADIVTALPELRPALDNYDMTIWKNGGYGPGGPWRLTLPEWTNGPYGDQPFIYGHMHVPGNTHWDPGDLDIKRLTSRAKELLMPAPEPWPLLKVGDKDPLHVPILEALLLVGGWRHTAWDGGVTYSKVMGRQVGRAQRGLGLKVDRVVGPKTLDALYARVAATR